MPSSTPARPRGASAPGCNLLSNDAVAFSFRDQHAKEVLVAGDFSGWMHSALPMFRGTDGIFRAVIQGLSPGLHQYKFLVDGRWTRDPANPLHRDDGHGDRNSAFVLGAIPPKPPGALRVGSLNLHTYQERDPITKLHDAAFALAAAEVDVLLLQEVAEHLSDRSMPNAGELMRASLVSQTGRSWNHHWHEAHIGFEVFREGLSILSALPLANEEWLQLSRGPLARGALSARLSAGRFEFLLATVHTSWDTHAHGEVSVLLDALKRRARNVDATLVAGDFNSGPRAVQVRAMRDAGFVDVGLALRLESPTFLDSPSERIDYHFLAIPKGSPAPAAFGIWRLLDGESRGFNPRVSDHAALVSEYKLSD